MRIEIKEVEDELYKTKDLIRVLCDTVYICMKEQRPVQHIHTLCPVIFEQYTRALQVFDDYTVQESKN